MSHACPNCGESDHQWYSTGFPGDQEQPYDPPGMVCGYCGFTADTDPGDLIDAAYEEKSYREDD
jgi:hypothetical protein